MTKEPTSIKSIRENNSDELHLPAHIQQAIDDSVREGIIIELTEAETEQAYHDYRQRLAGRWRKPEDVVLTPGQEKHAKQQAMERKVQATLSARYWKKVHEGAVKPQPVPTDVFAAWALKNSRHTVGFDFEVDEQNEYVFRVLSMYFNADEAVTRIKSNIDGRPVSLNRGIMLFGIYGVGKTSMFRLFANNPLQSYVMRKTRDIVNEYTSQSDRKANGPEVIQLYSRVYTGGSNYFGHKEYGIFFDDLGSERTEAKHYGNTVNVMQEIMQNRYDNQLPYNQTHVTTNLSREELEQEYGGRFADRMKQMFNMINFPKTAESRRV